MNDRSPWSLALQRGLDDIKERGRDERLMRAQKTLVALRHADDAHVERVVEDFGELRDPDWVSVSTAQAQPIQIFLQRQQTESAGGVSYKGFLDERSHHGVDRLRLPGALVAIAERSRPREESLFEAAVHAFDRFLAQVPDVVCGHDGLDVSRQPAATRTQIKRVMRDVDLEPAVDQLAEVRPIPQIACRPIDLVDHNARSRPVGQPSQ